jgi:hypothetical protein
MHAIFLSIVASIIVLVDCSTRGTRQGNIKYALKARPITLLFMIDVICILFLLWDF